MCPLWQESFLLFLRDMGPMPPDCNGIELIDFTGDFTVGNCKWVKNRSGRPQKRLLHNYKNRPPREPLVNPKSICLVLEKSLLDKIKDKAYDKSISAGYTIETNDLIRSVLKRAFGRGKAA